ncbi:MAG TPA: head maturation protease, ClpP-related [Candidatus Sulfotelmatobacter sp.]|nr:head maturation protease, ClpP-related [Candidatus Sulfotelmatobacter sp.]
MKSHNLSKPWSFQALANSTLEICLYDEIGDNGFGEGTTSRAFMEDLKQAGPVDSIHLRINSPGGAVFDGIAIYNALLTHGARITAQIDGLAASIASVICMSASTISMSRNSMAMLHNPHAVARGDSTDMRKLAEALDRVKSSIIMAYQRHIKLPAKEIAALMDRETWLSAQEAVDLGFADAVLDDGQALPISASADLSRYKNLPEQIAARVQKAEPAAEVYYPEFSGRSLEELNAEHEKLILQKRLRDSRYR